MKAEEAAKTADAYAQHADQTSETEAPEVAQARALVSLAHSAREVCAILRQVAGSDASAKAREREAFQLGVDRGAFEARRRLRHPDEAPDLEGVGIEWGRRRAAELADEFVASPAADGVKLKLRTFFMRAMCFEEDEK